MPKTTFIYALRDPISGLIRYIGKADNPKARLLGHIRDAKGTYIRKSHRGSWIRSLLAQGLRPVLEIVDEVSATEWQPAECAYVAFYRDDLGCPLVNGTPGGDGFGKGEDHPGYGKPKVHSPETRSKISQSHKGKVLSAETRAKISEVQKGKKIPPETIAKMRGRKNPHGATRVGPHSAETRRKISESNKGKQISDETRAKLRSANLGQLNPHFGKPRPATTRERIAAAHKGKKLSKEHRWAMSLAFRGAKRGPYPPERVAKALATRFKNATLRRLEEKKKQLELNLQ